MIGVFSYKVDACFFDGFMGSAPDGGRQVFTLLEKEGLKWKKKENVGSRLW
jgi:hypothetical protein